LVKLAAEGGLKRLAKSESGETEEVTTERLDRELDHCLDWLARAALLVA
jgi:hypothetical protein